VAQQSTRAIMASIISARSSVLSYEMEVCQALTGTPRWHRQVDTNREPGWLFGTNNGYDNRSRR